MHHIFYASILSACIIHDAIINYASIIKCASLIKAQGPTIIAEAIHQTSGPINWTQFYWTNSKAPGIISHFKVSFPSNSGKSGHGTTFCEHSEDPLRGLLNASF
jgi:hypothetical protein